MTESMGQANNSCNNTEKTWKVFWGSSFTHWSNQRVTSCPKYSLCHKKSVFFHGLTPQWECRIIMKIRTEARMITIQGTCWSWPLQIDHFLSRSRTDSRGIHSQAHKTVKEHSQPCSQSPPLFLRETLPAMMKHEFCQGKLVPWP